MGGDARVVLVRVAGAPVVEALVAVDQVGTDSLEPGHEQLADAGSQVQHDRRDRDRTGLERRPHHLFELVEIVGQARQDRCHEHAAGDAHVGEPRQRLEAAGRRRRARLGHAPHVLVERADRERRAEQAATGRVREDVSIAHDHGRLGEDRERVTGRRERLGDTAREPVAALARLVRVGVRAERDRVTRPLRVGELGAEAFDGVDLDDDALLEVLAAVEPEVLVGGACEAVRARVAAAAIRVDREPERHASALGNTADDALRAHVEVLDRREISSPGDGVAEQRGLSAVVVCEPPADGGPGCHGGHHTRTYVRIRDRR